jgi:tetratricopeptide (TPR) repeat protein
VRDGAAVRLTKPLNELKIPPTVQAISAARIDRLTPDHKDLLQTLALIGKEFKLGLVSKVAAKSGAELEPMLPELQFGEFIYEQPAIGDVGYTFKHALTHDVAYNSVLNERRRILHGRVGATLESIYTESLADQVAELAHHYSRSGNPRKGAEYCLRAVRQYVARGSYAEAVAQLETGLELLQKLPDDDQRAELELDLRNAVGYALMATKGYGSLAYEQSSARATELCRRPGINWEKTWGALYGVYLVHLNRPDLRKACEIGAERVARAEEHRSAEHIAAAERGLALVRMLSGDFELADQGYDRAWALPESGAKPATGLPKQRAGQAPHTSIVPAAQSNQVFNRVFSARNLWFLGYPDRALERVNVATAIAHESGSKALLEEVHDNAVIICELRRELEHLRERAEAMRALTTESGNVTQRARCEIYLGWAQAMAGGLDGVIARIRRYTLELKATGSEQSHDHYLALIATAQGRTGRFDEGLRTIDEAFPLIESTGQRHYEAEVHRLKGELILAQDVSNAARAEQSFRTAVEIARRQKAKSWELRATTSLARLLRDTNRRAEARAMLADIYNWFTEGFDTADLKDAKALLDELTT